MTREEAIDRLKEAKVGHKEFLSVETLNMAIQALEQEPCGYAISRQVVLDMLENINAETEGVGFYYEHYVEYIKNLPPVSPQPKEGYWEWNQYDSNPKIGNFHCSLCHIIGRAYYDYCPGCGAKMSEIPTGAEGSEE